MKNFKKILFIPMLLLIIGWILFNPYICSVNSEFVESIPNLINDFCKNINLNYRFSSGDVFNLLRFLEYFVFGVFAAILYRIYFKKIWANIANLLFLGLLIPIAEVLYRNIEGYVFSAQDILISFFEFCAGALIVLVFSAPKNKKVFSSKYKKNKYTGRS